MADVQRAQPVLPPRSQWPLLDAETIISLSLDLRDCDRGEEALPLLRTAVRHNAGYSRLWQVLALLYRWAGDSAAAADAFRQAEKLAPNDVKVIHGLAQASLEAGYPAVHLFERARRLAPADGDIILGKAAAQLAQGKGEEAIAELDAILAHHPSWVAGQSTLARFRWMLGERNQLTTALERGLDAAPGHLPLWVELIDLLLQMDEFERADQAVSRARAATGAEAELNVWEAICASELGQVARADRLFDACDLVSTSPLGAARHMRHLLRTGRPAEAAMRGEPLITHPDAHHIWPYLGLAWRLLGDPRWDWLEGDPRLVGVYDVGGAVALDDLAERLRAIHFSAQPPLGQSVRHGTQTDGPLFARAEPEIRALRKLVVAILEKHIASLPPPDPAHPLLSRMPAKVRFAGSWSVRLTSSGHHTNHIHPVGWLSSAFYVVVPSKHYLGPEPAGWLALGQPPPELATGLPPIRMVEPRPGRLILFPSTMWHGTVPYDQGERMSVAFDVARA